MHYSIVVAGGGPAGLTSARVLAEAGHNVLLLERKAKIGPKVCAGGITWSGLINKLPGQLEEKRFPIQHIYTRLQHATVQERQPIIATVNRERLGQYMASIALQAGATLQTGCQIQHIDKNALEYLEKATGQKKKVTFDYLIGADGSTSIVRRYLGLQTENVGIGINYQIPRHVKTMEWHLNRRYFGNGYGWIFPHSDTVSIGAYADQKTMAPSKLKGGLQLWASGLGYDLSRQKAKAELINFDYRGWEFDNVFLVGDAAGFASGLTGEGIYPAIVSGEYVGQYIAKLKCNVNNFQRLVRMQKLHATMVKLTGWSPFLADVIAESVTLGLRTGLLSFRKLEMAR
jgi:geranylgeranyl reductase